MQLRHVLGPQSRPGLYTVEAAGRPLVREHVVGGVRIELVTGDLADQPDVDAVVKAANAQLRMGGGVPGRSIELLVLGSLRRRDRWPRSRPASA